LNFQLFYFNYCYNKAVCLGALSRYKIKREETSDEWPDPEEGPHGQVRLVNLPTHAHSFQWWQVARPSPRNQG